MEPLPKRTSSGIGKIPPSPKAASSSSYDDTEGTPFMVDRNTTRKHKLQTRSTISTLEEVTTATWFVEESMGTMGPVAFVVNMFCDLCPPGLLPLASGLRGTGYVPGLAILCTLCSFSVYTMWTVSRTKEITGKVTYRGMWEKTLGEGSSWVPVATIVSVCFGCNLSYSCFFADLFAEVMPAFGFTNLTRSWCLGIFTVFPLLPLCMLRDLSALAPTSFVAMLVVVYTTWMMCYRAIDGSYADGGTFYASLPEKPDIPSGHLWTVGPESLVLVNFLAMAFLTHYNACKYYRELAKHTPGRMKRVTATGMGITSAFYVVTSVAGYMTFGSTTQGVILENYHKSDTLANIARVGMGFSIICSFPLMFSGLREATIELITMVRPTAQHKLHLIWCQNLLSLALLLVLTICAGIFVDAGLVVGLVGAICGSAVIYVIPCLLYQAAMGQHLMPEKHRREILFNRCVVGMGVVLGVLGAVTAVSQA